MKKLIILIIILGYSMPSWAKWQGMQIPLPTKGDKYFVDPSSLNERFINSANYSTVRVVVNHSKAERLGQLSEVALWEANCSERVIRLRTLAGYRGEMGKGSIFVINNNPKEWEVPDLNSLEEAIQLFMCGPPK